MERDGSSGFWVTLSPAGVPRFEQNSCEKLKSAGEDCVVFCRSAAGEVSHLLLFLWFGSSVGHWSDSATAQLSSHTHRHGFIWPQDGGGGAGVGRGVMVGTAGKGGGKTS